MPLPDRPVANTTIDSEWGQAVHDWTFAPTGTWLQSSATTSCGTSFTQLRLDQAIQDPGGWMDASPLPGVAVVPSGADGLYVVICRVVTVSGTAGNATQGLISVNGASLTLGNAVNDGGVAVNFTLSDFLALSAGDQITVSARKIGGSNPSCTVGSLALFRIGDTVGA